MQNKEMTAKMTEGLFIADTVSTGLGRKFAKLLPEPLTIQTQTPMASPFGLSTFPGDKGSAMSAQRVSLDLRCTDPATLAIFQEIDEWAPGEFAKHSERIFGKKMSLEQVQASSRPCLRCKQGFVPLLHTKITLDGPNSTSFWDQQKQKCDPPDDFRHTSVLLKLVVPHLWISAGTCGFVVNATSCQLQPQQPVNEECPF